MLGDGEDSDAARREQANEHKSERAAADQRRSVTLAHSGFIDAAQHARQRLNESGVAKTDVLGDFEKIFTHDAAGNTHIFGVRAVIEDKVFAQILLAAQAIEAAIARRG